MLSPASIEQKQFTATRFKEGYDQNEVDEFLDRVGSDYKWHVDRVAELEAEVKNLRRSSEASTVKMPSAQPSMESVERLLIVAQQTADQQAQDAITEANKVKAEAQRNAEAILDDARTRADEVINEAHSERLNQIAALEAREAQLSSAVERLEVRAGEARQWVEQALKSFDRGTAKEAADG